MAQLRVKRTSSELATQKLLPGELGLADDKLYVGVYGTENKNDNTQVNPTRVLLAGQDATVDNLTVDGNLTVNGTTTVIDTTNLQVEDSLIVLNKNSSGASAPVSTSRPVGIVLSGAGSPPLSPAGDRGSDLILGANNPGGRLKVAYSNGETGDWDSARTIAYTDDIPTAQVTTTGDGNVVTDGIYSNGTITLKKDAKAALVTDSTVNFEGTVIAELIQSNGGLSSAGDLDVGGNLAVTGGATVGGKNVSLEGHTHANATTSTSGFMSAADKTKLDNVLMPSAQSQGRDGHVIPVVDPDVILQDVAQDTTSSSVVPLGILKDGATSAIVLYGENEIAVIGLEGNKIKIARYNQAEHGQAAGQKPLNNILTSNLAEEINNIDCGTWE